MTRPPDLSAAVAAGAAAQRAGREFEEELEATHDALGDAVALQRGNVRAIRVRGNQWKVTGKSGVDFVGAVRGVPVAFDAKSRAGATEFRLELGRTPEARVQGNASDLAELRFLLRTIAAGGIGFFLVRDVALGRIYAVGGRMRLEALARGEAVALRQAVRAGGQPLVPCVELSEAARLRWQRLGLVTWDWTTLLPALRAAL